jgi:hypothetical protein
VTTDETGSVDAQVASSATESTEIDGTNTTVEASESSAGTENTDPGAAQEHMIPKSRLDQEIGKRKGLEEELQDARSKLEQMAPKEEEPAKEAAPAEPPPGMTQRDQLKWYVQHFSEEMIQERLGMSLEDAATALSASRTTGQDYTQRRWVEECQKHNLDPSHKKTMKIVTSLVESGAYELQEALGYAQRLYGKEPGEQGDQTERASVETAGISPVMAREGRIPQSKEEATEMATKGQHAKRLSSQEIIDRRNEMLKKASGGGSNIRRLE